MKSSVIVKNPQPGQFDMQCQDCEWQRNFRNMNTAAALTTSVNHSKRHLLRAIFAKMVTANLSATNRAEGN